MVLVNEVHFLEIPLYRPIEPVLKGLDEEAAVFMNVQPRSKREEVWELLNTSMSCREKLHVLKRDFNPGEKRLVKKWILRKFPEMQSVEPHFLNYLKGDERVQAAELVEKRNFKELDRIVGSYSRGQIQLYESWKACAINKTPKIEIDQSVSKIPIKTTASEPQPRPEITNNVEVWLLYYLITYSVYIGGLFILFLKIKEVIENGRVHGQARDWFLKIVLYIPSIAFTFYYPLVEKQKTEHPSIASPWLRLLITVVAGLFVFYEIFYIVLCGTQYYGWTCSSEILFERVLELLFFIGLAIFMTHNNCYPREHKYCFAHLCSAAVYAYVNIFIQEEMKIFEEILKNQNSTMGYSTLTSYRNYSRNTRGYRMAEPVQVLPSSVSTFMEDYLEMCYVVISEFLVVAISITVAILNDLGNEKRPQEKSCNSLWEKSPPFKQAVFGSILLIFVTSYFNSSASVGKTLFIGLHFIILAAGTTICLNSLKPTNEEEEDNPLIMYQESPSDILDRYLLNFGSAGMLCSITVGTIHLYGTLSESLSFATLLIYGASIVQVIAQTLIILSGSRIRNIKGWNGKELWLVNFALFCLDLYNAATLGVYAMPIPKNTNLLWAWLVRGLGSFEVFYRFHSLAVIAENIEFHEKIDMEKKWSGRYSVKQKGW